MEFPAIERAKTMFMRRNAENCKTNIYQNLTNYNQSYRLRNSTTSLVLPEDEVDKIFDDAIELYKNITKEYIKNADEIIRKSTTNVEPDYTMNEIDLKTDSNYTLTPCHSLTYDTTFVSIPPTLMDPLSLRINEYAEGGVHKNPAESMSENISPLQNKKVNQDIIAADHDRDSGVELVIPQNLITEAKPAESMDSDEGKNEVMIESRILQSSFVSKSDTTSATKASKLTVMDSTKPVEKEEVQSTHHQLFNKDSKADLIECKSRCFSCNSLSTSDDEFNDTDLATTCHNYNFEKTSSNHDQEANNNENVSCEEFDRKLAKKWGKSLFNQHVKGISCKFKNPKVALKSDVVRSLDTVADYLNATKNDDYKHKHQTPLQELQDQWNSRYQNILFRRRKRRKRYFIESKRLYILRRDARYHYNHSDNNDTYDAKNTNKSFIHGFPIMVNGKLDELSPIQSRLTSRLLCFGAALHLSVNIPFNPSEIFSREGKDIMAKLYNIWRLKAMCFVKWQLYSSFSSCVEENIINASRILHFFEMKVKR